MKIKHTNKIKKHTAKAMRAFTAGECYKVKRRLRGKTSNNPMLMCHDNVQYWVDRIGGKRIEGWMRRYDFKDVAWTGVSQWMWHSIWETPEGEWVDVTASSHFDDKGEHIVFWHDKRRATDLKEGVIYNNIAVFEKQDIANVLSASSNYRLRRGNVYWSAEGSTSPSFKSINEFDGRCLLLGNEYPKNKEHFNKWVDKHSVNDCVPSDIAFHFNVGFAA